MTEAGEDLAHYNIKAVSLSVDQLLESQGIDLNPSNLDYKKLSLEILKAITQFPSIIITLFIPATIRIHQKTASKRSLIQMDTNKPPSHNQQNNPNRLQRPS